MAKIDTLVYDFATSVSPWSTFIWTGATDQRASMVATDLYPTASISGHDCVDAKILARVWPAGGGLSGYTNNVLRLRSDSSNFAVIVIAGAEIRLHVRNGGVDTYAGTRPYNPTSDAWLRIGDVGNATIVAETSADGLTWTELGRTSHTWSGATVSVAFQSGRTTAVPDSPLYVDNINNPPPPPPSGLSVQVRSGGAWTAARTISHRAAGAWVNAAIAEPAADAQDGRLLFDSRFEQVASVLSSYPDTNPETVVEGQDFGLTTDPDPSKSRTVAWFDSWARKHTGNNLPRSAANTDFIIKAAYHGNTVDEYWYAVSSYLPESSKLTTDGQNLSHVTTGFGPPYAGSSPARMSIHPRFNVSGVWTGENVWTFGGRASAFGTGPNVVIPYDTWVFHLLHCKFAYDGWVEVFQHVDGAQDATWQRLPIDGYTTGPAPIAPLAAGVNDAWVNDVNEDACYTGIGVYGTEPRRRYFAHHRVGTSKAAVDGAGNGWWIAPLP